MRAYVLEQIVQAQLIMRLSASLSKKNQSLIDQTFHALTDKQLSYPQKNDCCFFRQVYPESRFDFFLRLIIFLGMSYAKEKCHVSNPDDALPNC